MKNNTSDNIGKGIASVIFLFGAMFMSIFAFDSSDWLTRLQILLPIWGGYGVVMYFLWKKGK